MKRKELLEKIFEGKKPNEIAIVIGGATGFRTTQIEELTEAETRRILDAYVPKKNISKEDEATLRNWRTNILTVASRTGIKSPYGWEEFNRWMKQSSVHKKELYKLNIEELKDTHKQLLMVEKNNAKSSKKYGTKAYWRKGEQNITQN